MMEYSFRSGDTVGQIKTMVNNVMVMSIMQRRGQIQQHRRQMCLRGETESGWMWRSQETDAHKDTCTSVFFFYFFCFLLTAAWSCMHARVVQWFSPRSAPHSSHFVLLSFTYLPVTIETQQRRRMLKAGWGDRYAGDPG